MKQFLAAIVILGLLALAAFWLLTMPSTIPAAALVAGYQPDLKNGQTMFNIGGCAACHESVGQKDRLKLGGGKPLRSPFGTFYAPNISPDTGAGIGGWSELQFVNAIQRGVGADGQHLYPALPYTSYQRMKVSDVRDLFAYIKTLAPVTTPSRPHAIGFPFNIRRTLWVWKLLYLDGKEYTPDPHHSTVWNRGAYLVEGPGHCAECHSPRDQLGGILPDRRFAGAPNLEGQGWIPNITPGEGGIKWSKDDMESFLETGSTPDFDSAGGSMAEVILNTARLTPADRAAMSDYLVSLPPKVGKKPDAKPGDKKTDDKAGEKS